MRGTTWERTRNERWLDDGFFEAQEHKPQGGKAQHPGLKIEGPAEDLLPALTRLSLVGFLALPEGWPRRAPLRFPRQHHWNKNTNVTRVDEPLSENRTSHCSPYPEVEIGNPLGTSRPEV